MFQNMYALAMTIDHCYWKCDHEYYHARQAEKEVLESYSWRQEKASTSGPATAFQNKANPSLAFPSTKNFSSKSPTSKKQSDSLQVDLSFKLASNGKLTSDKCKKHLENNLCLYCGAGDYKLDVKIVDDGLHFYFLVLFYFIFIFIFSFIFYF